MTIATLFLVLVPTYLVLIAYGQIGSRWRGLAFKSRLIAATVRVIVPPLAVFGALLATRDAYLISGWGGVTLAMLVAGAIVAGLVEWIAPKVGA